MKQKCIRSVTLKQTGIIVSGVATIQLWDGFTGEIDIDETFIPLNEKLTKERLLNCVNDGKYGCEAIMEASIDIDDFYENGYREHNRTILAREDRYISQYGKRGTHNKRGI